MNFSKIWVGHCLVFCSWPEKVGNKFQIESLEVCTNAELQQPTICVHCMETMDYTSLYLCSTTVEDTQLYWSTIYVHCTKTIYLSSVKQFTFNREV